MKFKKFKFSSARTKSENSMSAISTITLMAKISNFVIKKYLYDPVFVVFLNCQHAICENCVTSWTWLYRFDNANHIEIILPTYNWIIFDILLRIFKRTSLIFIIQNQIQNYSSESAITKKSKIFCQLMFKIKEESQLE